MTHRGLPSSLPASGQAPTPPPRAQPLPGPPEREWKGWAGLGVELVLRKGASEALEGPCHLATHRPPQPPALTRQSSCLPAALSSVLGKKIPREGPTNDPLGSWKSLALLPSLGGEAHGLWEDYRGLNGAGGVGSLEGLSSWAFSVALPPCLCGSLTFQYVVCQGDTGGLASIQ